MEGARQSPWYPVLVGGLSAACLVPLPLIADVSTRHDGARGSEVEAIALGLVWMWPWAFTLALPICVGGAFAAAALASRISSPRPRIVFGHLFFAIVGGLTLVAMACFASFLWPATVITAMSLIAIVAVITAAVSSSPTVH